MLDVRFIRDNAALVKEAVHNKNEKADIDRILELDAQKRKLQFDYDTKRAEQNRVSKQVPILKKQGLDASGLIAEMQKIAAEVKAIGQTLGEITAQLDAALLVVPNVPHPSVPIGRDESDNELVHEWGEKRKFDFVPKDHLALADGKLLDFKRPAKLTGSGFAGYTGVGALLERALINFMLDFHVQKHGYNEISLPYIVSRTTMTGTGQLPKLEDDMYHISEDDLFLIPTAEVPVTNYYANEILKNDQIPQKFVAYSPCFRREAGSYGKDTKGLQRLHQFNKVEMVRFSEPDVSYDVLEEMVRDAEDLLQALELHYRVVTLATGDLSFASAKTYDLEVWAPGTGRYLEVSSVSNFEAFQARRANIRYRDANDKVSYVHTLNGSGLATPRTFIALIETWQNADGSISIPEALRPYLYGMEQI